jgi:hypothetical protein
VTTWALWGHIIELAGFLVTILSLHMANVRAARKYRETMLQRFMKMEGEVNLMYRWFQKHVVKANGENNEEKTEKTD